MARGRMINQTIDFDPEFNALSLEAQLIYLRTVAFLDRDGLIIGHPYALLARVAPLMEKLLPDMPFIIDEWVTSGLVIRYASKVGDTLFFKGFAKNQSGMHYDRESPSRFDPPPGWAHGPKGLIPIPSEPLPPVESNDAQSESDDTPTLPESSAQTESGITPAEVLQESGESPAQIEVKDQIEDQPELREEEQTHARDPLSVAWRQVYDKIEMPPKLAKSLQELVTECGMAAAIHGIKASAAKEDGRNFRYIAECARNYVPPPPLASYANGHSNGSYHVDLPGVHKLEPPAERATPPPPLPPPMPHDDPWSVALAELLPTLSSQCRDWLEGSALSAEKDIAGEPLYEILVSHPAANIQWLTQQLEPTIRRKLKTLLGKRINLAFVHVAEPAAARA